MDKTMDFSDHDLVIRIDTRLTDLQKTVQEIRDGTISRIQVLERDKADRRAVEELQHKMNNDIEIRVRDLEEKEVDPKEHKDLLRSMENNNIYLKWTLMLVAILIAIISWHILGFRLP